MRASLDFNGAINLSDWWQCTADHGSYNVIVGRVRILTEDDLGFKIRTNGQANYVVQVSGPTGNKVSFPGCKVYGFEEFAGDGPTALGPNGIYVVP